MLALWLAPGSGIAQERAPVRIEHWAMAPFFGTGAYQFDEMETVWVFEYTPRWTLRPPSPDGSVTRRAGIEILVPATIGLSHFDLGDPGETLDPDNVATLSVVPGAYLTLEMNPRWTLLGTVNLGLGGRLDGSETALIHRLGLRSRYRLNDDEDGHWFLVASLERFGYHTDRDSSGRTMPLSLTAQYEHALGSAHVVAHLTATHYLDSLSISEIDDLGAAITNDVEVGIAYRPDERLRLWRLSWERIGIAYRRGEGDGGAADFEGVRLFFRSVFEQ